MKLLSWNINGIRACVKKGFVSFLTDYQPDIIGLQEIKIDDARRAAHDFDFKAYQEFWFPAQKPGYSGTAILTKIKPLSYQTGLGIKKFDQEGRIQTLEFAKIYFINVYFPNAQPELARLKYKIEFNSALLKYIKKLDKKKPVIITGDFNVAREEIDLARPKDNIGNPGFSKEERAWANKFLQSGLVDTFRQLHPTKIQYSWWTFRSLARQRNIGWRIDYFMVSAKIMKHVKKAFILDQVQGSDHAPVGIEIDL